MTRLPDEGQRIPFGLIDADSNGTVSKPELVDAFHRIFPSLSGEQLTALADTAFGVLEEKGLSMDRNSWAVAEGPVVAAAKGMDIGNAQITGSTPSGWASDINPSGNQVVGQSQIPLSPSNIQMPGYMPRNDLGVTGIPPYQYPVGMGSSPVNMSSPASRVLSGAVQVGEGWLKRIGKSIPIVGSLINGFDFIRDVGKATQTFGNPTKTFGEKVKAGADLLVHGAGALFGWVPGVGALTGTYDMVAGGLTAGGAVLDAARGRPWMSQMPPFNYNNGGYPNMYNMQYGTSSAAQMMMQTMPYMASAAMQGMQSMQYGGMQYPNAPYQSFYNPGFQQYPNYQMSGLNPALMPYMDLTNIRRGTPIDGVQGGIRAAFGMAEMFPGVGTLVNAGMAAWDVKNIIQSIGDPTRSTWQATKDLLFNVAGMFIPMVGGIHDMYTGGSRALAAATAPRMNLPMFQPQYPLY